MNFNKEKYLNRIRYLGGFEPNLNNLKELQKSHLLNVPFENLDIHYNTKINLNIDHFYEKIVENNRGGFCYELNGLFHQLLRSLGFNVYLVSARVYEKKNGYSPEFDHMAIVATINGKKYLADVGFGEFIFEPIKIEFNSIQKDPRGDYFIDNYKNDYYRVSRIENENLMPEFIFKDKARRLEEFTEMCYYHQSDPNSHFMKKRLISLPTENGRVTISGSILKIKEKESTKEKELKDEFEFEKELWDKFKVKIVNRKSEIK